MVGYVVGEYFADFFEGVGGCELCGGVADDELVFFRYEVVDVDESLRGETAEMAVDCR